MISAYLAKSVEEKNIKGIQGALKGVIDSDPAFKLSDGVTCDFDEAIRYIRKKGISDSELFDKHDNQYFQEDNKELWTREYFFKVLNYLSYNFSEERIDHLKRVGSAVMAEDKVYREKIKAPSQADQKKKQVPIQKTKTFQGSKLSILFLVIVVILVIVLFIKRF